MRPLIEIQTIPIEIQMKTTNAHLEYARHLQEKVTVGFFWRICYNKVIEYVLNIQKIDTRWNAI